MANFNTGLTKQQIITALTKALESMSEQEVQSAISTAISGKQDILSFDNTPTSGSNNPVKSGGIYTDQQRQETEVGVVAALGAKNLLREQSLNFASGTGVTITPNGDGTYTLSGTPTGTATFLYTSSGNLTDLLGLEAGKEYTISSGSGKVLIRVDYSINGNSWESTSLVNNIPTSATFTLPNTAVGLYIRFRSTAATGSLDGIVLRPMIRPAEITDDTYVPYAPTNRELYEAKITPEDVFGAGTLIQDNTDLNTLTAIGKYYGGNSAGNSCSNLPIANGSFNFTMEVKQVTPSAIVQTLKVCNIANDPYIYIRRRTTSTWQSWYRFTGEAVAAVSQSAAASMMQAGRIDAAEMTDNIDNDVSETSGGEEMR